MGGHERCLSGGASGKEPDKFNDKKHDIQLQAESSCAYVVDQLHTFGNKSISKMNGCVSGIKIGGAEGVVHIDIVGGGSVILVSNSFRKNIVCKLWEPMAV